MQREMMVSKYLQIQLPLKRYAFVYLKNIQDAEDVVQAAFIKAWLGCDKFDVHCFIPWIYRVVHNECIDLHRKSKWIDKTVEVDKILACAENVSSVDPSVALWAKDLIERLPDDWQRNAELYFLCGIRCVEISKLRGRSYTTVRNQIVKTKLYLRERT